MSTGENGRPPVADLRQAAADLREYHDVMTRSAQLAIADWLEAAAEVAWRTESEGASVHPDSHALKVARAILGTPETENDHD